MNSSASQPLRTVVAGLGRIGFGFHCPSIIANPGFALVGIVDPLPDRRGEARARFGTATSDSLEDMLGQTNPDLVVVASPTPFHAGQALTAFAHGAHVFCDKPIARTLAEFDRMAAAAQTTGRRLVAYQPCRHQPELRTLRTLVEQGMLGPVHLIRRSRCNYERRKDWQAFKAHGGGLLNNYGSHCLDELLWLLGDDTISRVYCHTRSIATAGDADDFVKASLTTARGLLIDLEISQASALTGPVWEVFGAYGAARYDAGQRTWLIRHYDVAAAPPLEAQNGFAAADRLYHTETLPWHEQTLQSVGTESFDYYEALRRHLVEGAVPPVTLEETRSLLTLLERCRASTESGTCT
ncbi:MAG: Gfo/Idh/MocA family oxidoreductase [Verrucomicrobiota bacterium]